jgi:hypothetical protein
MNIQHSKGKDIGRNAGYKQKAPALMKPQRSKGKLENVARNEQNIPHVDQYLAFTEEQCGEEPPMLQTRHFHPNGMKGGWDAHYYKEYTIAVFFKKNTHTHTYKAHWACTRLK